MPFIPPAERGGILAHFYKPGGGGLAAVTLVAKAMSDGYALPGIFDHPNVTVPHVQEGPLKSLDGFTFTATYGTKDTGLVALTESSFQSLKDMVEFARPTLKD
jgi:tripartite-type tricarboxylate transporter receptor subunit TctC